MTNHYHRFDDGASEPAHNDENNNYDDDNDENDDIGNENMMTLMTMAIII